MPTIEDARSWYPSIDPVHGFDHVLRVYHLAEHLAQEEGADMEIVRAAVLLHDAARGDEVIAGEQSPSDHHTVSADFAQEVLDAEGWSSDRIKAVQHCIRAHRFRDDSERPETREAKVVFDADKLDAIGAIGVARAVAYAAQNGQPAFVQPSDRFLETGEKEVGEPHSAYHEYLYKLTRLLGLMYTASGRAIAEERHRYMVAFFERLIVEVNGDKKH